MKLDCTYICVHDMQKSIEFYTQLLQLDACYENKERWVQFDCGHRLALYNQAFDQEIFDKNLEKEYFNESYIADFKQDQKLINTSVVLNFIVEDVRQEYKRCQSLNIGIMSELMFVNVTHPYWYFTIQDPDGNVCEITGEYL